MSNSSQVSILKEGIIAKDIKSLAKAISLVESSKDTDKILANELISKMLPFAGKLRRIGISGTPGAGKSTLIESLGLHFIQNQQKVAVLAVDPSSAITKGSILGDKTRMEHLSKSENAFIRPSPSRGYFGGVAVSTFESILLLESFGFDTILVETVGVGQSETMVKDMVDLFILVTVAGGGDELQGMKRGIMEISDIIFLNKVDAEPTKNDMAYFSNLRRSVPLFQKDLQNWNKPVLMGSALNNKNIDGLNEQINTFFEIAESQNHLSSNRQQQNQKRFEKILQQSILDQYLPQIKHQENYPQILDQIKQGTLFPMTAIAELTQNMG